MTDKPVSNLEPDSQASADKTNSPKPHPLDKSVQYTRQKPQTGSVGVYIDYEAQTRSWLSIPKAAWVIVLTSSLLAICLVLGSLIHRDILTLIALLCAALVSIGLPRTVGAPAPRYSSAVSLIFSLTSVAAVRALDDLYIAGIVCALSVVGAFIAEMLRQDGRGRLVDSISVTELTTVAATCAVAIVGLAPHSSWELALTGASVCAAGSTIIFQIMRLSWAGSKAAAAQLQEIHLDTARWAPNTWSTEGTEEYSAMQAVTYYWRLTETARTLAVVLSGIFGAICAAVMLNTNLITGTNTPLVVSVSDWFGSKLLATTLIGLLIGLLCGGILQVGNRIIRPTTPRTSLWGAISWGVLPTICVALPTYALVRLAGA